jgi:hypothetical protein
MPFVICPFLNGLLLYINFNEKAVSKECWADLIEASNLAFTSVSKKYFLP